MDCVKCGFQISSTRELEHEDVDTCEDCCASLEVTAHIKREDKLRGEGNVINKESWKSHD
jgi:hypothetical protein